MILRKLNSNNKKQRICRGDVNGVDENMIPFILLRPQVILIAVVVAKRKPKEQKRKLKHGGNLLITTAAVGFLGKNGFGLSSLFLS